MCPGTAGQPCDGCQVHVGTYAALCAGQGGLQGEVALAAPRCWQMMFTDPRFPANWGSTAIDSGICIIWYTSIIILGLVSSGSWFERASTVHFSTSPRWLKPVVSSQLLFSWSGAWFSNSINQPSQFLVEHVEHPNITNIFLVDRQTFRLTRPSTEMGQELSQLGNNMDFYAVAAPRLRGRKCAFSMRVFDARSGKGHYGDCAGIGCTMIQLFKSATSNLGTKRCVENNISSTDLPIQYIQQLSRLSYFPT